MIIVFFIGKYLVKNISYFKNTWVQFIVSNLSLLNERFKDSILNIIDISNKVEISNLESEYIDIELNKIELKTTRLITTKQLQLLILISLSWLILFVFNQSFELFINE